MVRRLINEVRDFGDAHTFCCIIADSLGMVGIGELDISTKLIGFYLKQNTNQWPCFINIYSGQPKPQEPQVLGLWNGTERFGILP